MHRILRQLVGALVDNPITPDMLATLRLASSPVTPLVAIVLGVMRSGQQSRSPVTGSDGPEADLA